jgi:hypothetical protein
MVGCSNFGSSKAHPSRVVPDRGQVPEYSVESSSGDGGDVLQEDEPRSKYANGFGDVSPDARLLAIDSLPVACVGDVLAREARADDVDLADEFGPVEGGDVPEVGDVGVVVRKDLGGVAVDLCQVGDALASEFLNRDF